MQQDSEPISSQPYNRPFFRLYENFFLVLRDTLGEDEALGLMRRVFSKALGESYESSGFTQGSTSDFARVVGERDESVGLHVAFLNIADDGLVYRFHTDPFPGLKGEVEPGKLDATYIEFKVSCLLGRGWKYQTTRHLWDGDDFTEHVIKRA